MRYVGLYLCHNSLFVRIKLSIVCHQTIVKREQFENERIPVYNPSNEEITVVQVNRLSNQVLQFTHHDLDNFIVQSSRCLLLNAIIANMHNISLSVFTCCFLWKTEAIASQKNQYCLIFA